MEITYNDTINKSVGTDQVTVVIEPDKATSRVKGDRQDIIVQDTYDIVPSKTRLTVDYTLPTSLTTGLFVDVATLRSDFTALAATQEAWNLAMTAYTYDDLGQRLTSVESTGINNSNLEASVFGLDLSSYAITDTGGVVTATFQEILDKVVVVENNSATHTQDIQIQANNYGSAVSRIETLEASSGDYSAKITDLAVVAAGDFILWDGTTPDPNHIGNVIYTTTDTYPIWGSNTTTNPIRTAGTATTDPIYNKLWQFLGTDIESTNSGWRLIENLNGTFGSAKSVYTDSTGAIVGWAYKGGSGSPSEFIVRADTFGIKASGQSVAVQEPFTVNATTGIITLKGSVLFEDANSSLGTTTIDGGNITANSLTADHIQSNTLVGTIIQGGEYLLINSYSKLCHLTFSTIVAAQPASSSLTVNTGIYSPNSSNASKKRINSSTSIIQSIALAIGVDVTIPDYSSGIIGVSLINGGETIDVQVKSGTTVLGSATMTALSGAPYLDEVVIAGMKFTLFKSPVVPSACLCLDKAMDNVYSSIATTNTDPISIVVSRNTAATANFYGLKTMFVISNI